MKIHADATAIDLRDSAGDEPACRELTDVEKQILDFEHNVWRFAGSKEEAIRRRFGISAARYFQMLNSLLDFPEAMTYDPMVVRRLRRLRRSRRRARHLSRQ